MHHSHFYLGLTSDLKSGQRSGQGWNPGPSQRLNLKPTLALILRGFLSLLLALTATLTLATGAIAQPQAIAAPLSASVSPAPLAVLPFLNGVFRGTVPALGLNNGQLQPCPVSPNCVVSQGSGAEDGEHTIAPLTYGSDRDTARQVLLQVLTVVPGAVVVDEQDDYIRAEFTSKLMGFVDDGEFYFPADEPVIQVRSASRLGESDLGVNRRRLEQIRLALADLGL